MDSGSSWTQYLPLLSLGPIILGGFGLWYTMRRRFTITVPADETVHEEHSRVSGIGAPSGWMVLLLHLTDKWYLQEQAAKADEKGEWRHYKCHYDNSFIGRDRFVCAVAVPSQEQVDALIVAFGGWGPAPTGNKRHVAAEDLDKVLKESLELYKKTPVKRIRRVAGK